VGGILVIKDCRFVFLGVALIGLHSPHTVCLKFETKIVGAYLHAHCLSVIGRNKSKAAVNAAALIEQITKVAVKPILMRDERSFLIVLELSACSRWLQFSLIAAVLKEKVPKA